MYIKPLSTIVDLHSIIHHSFVDNLHLRMFAILDEICKLLHSSRSCIDDVKALTTVNMLKLNNKAEFMLVTSTRAKRLHSQLTSVTIANHPILF